MPIHSEECLQKMEKQRAEIQMWINKWPNHCKICGGWGVITQYQSHGDGGPSEPLSEPCASCLGQGRCPRCGSENIEMYTVPEDNYEWTRCLVCGWNEDEASKAISSGMVMPFGGSCTCQAEEDEIAFERYCEARDSDREVNATAVEPPPRLLIVINRDGTVSALADGTVDVRLYVLDMDNNPVIDDLHVNVGNGINRRFKEYEYIGGE